MKRIFTKLFSLLALVATLMGALLLPNETSAELEGGYGVPLTGTPITVDSITLYGVTVTADFRGDEGPYNDDNYYVCNALVRRFYKEVFGVKVTYSSNGPVADSGSFRETRDPKVGDIIYYSDGTHVALVKERNGNQVLSIQQNSWWADHTTAWVGATASIYDTTLRFFTWDPGETLPAGCHIPTFNFYSLNANCGENTAILSATIDNNDRTEVYGVGCRVYDGNGILLKEVTRNMSCYDGVIWADFNLYQDMGLKINTTEVYGYEFVVYYYGFCTTSTRQYFCAGSSNQGSVADTPVASPKFSSTNSKLILTCAATDITAHNATISYTAIGNGNYCFDKVELFIGKTVDCQGLSVTYTDEDCVESRTMTVNMQKDLNKTLEPNTTYYYFFVGRVNGSRYVSDIYSFTTGK